MPTYKFNLSVKSISEIENILGKLDKLLKDKRLYQFIGEKCFEALKEISVRKLSTIQTEEDIEASKYMNSHNLEIRGDTIYLYNDSVIDTSTKQIKDRSKYPLQLSLAKIVEYGIGYEGSIYANSEAENWEYDVNKHGESGWVYMTEDGKFHTTNGFAGRYVFLELKHYIEKNIGKWISEYVKLYL